MPTDLQESKFIQTPFDDMTWPEKIEFVQRISMYPALTVLVFLRRKVGFRLLKTTRLITMAIIMIVAGIIGENIPLPLGPMYILRPRPTDGVALILFAITFLVAGFWQQRQRWKDIKQGVVWHTYHEGISRLSFLPLPQYIVWRYADPLAVIVIGLLVLIVSRPLGFWLIYSAMFLTIYEQARYEKRLQRDLDAYDALWEAQLQKENLRHLGGNKAGSTQRHQIVTRPVPTGMAADVERQIARNASPRSAA